MRGMRLLPVVLVLAVAAGILSLWRDPTVRGWLGSGGPISGKLGIGSPSPIVARPDWPGTIFYLKEEPGGQGVWSVAPTGSEKRRLGGPLAVPVGSWAGAQDFALLVDVDHKAWVATGGALRSVDVGDLRPDSLRVPPQRLGSHLYLYGETTTQRPVLLQVGANTQTTEVFRGKLPTARIIQEDPNQFILVLSDGTDNWQAVSLNYATGKLISMDGGGQFDSVSYSRVGGQLFVHTVGRTFTVDTRTWTPTGSIRAWAVPAGSQALLVVTGAQGLTAALAPADHLDQAAVWPQLSSELQAANGGAGAVWMLDDSHDSFLLEAASNPADPTHRVLAAFQRDQAVVDMGVFPVNRFVGAAGDGFALGGEVGADGRVPALRYYRSIDSSQLWANARVLGLWSRVYGVVVLTEQQGSSELGVLTNSGYDRLERVSGAVTAYAGESAAVVVAGPAAGGNNLRLIDPQTRAVTVLDTGAVTAISWAE